MKDNSDCCKDKNKESCKQDTCQESKDHDCGCHIYKMLELTGTSCHSIEEAVNNAVCRASKTVRGLRWLEVIDTRAHIDNGKVSHWQVTIKIGFVLES